MTTFILAVGFLLTFVVGVLTGAALALLGVNKKSEGSSGQKLLDPNAPTRH
jgi:hypothetical protein